MKFYLAIIFSFSFFISFAQKEKKDDKLPLVKINVNAGNIYGNEKPKYKYVPVKRLRTYTYYNYSLDPLLKNVTIFNETYVDNEVISAKKFDEKTNKLQEEFIKFHEDSFYYEAYDVYSNTKTDGKLFINKSMTLDKDDSIYKYDLNREIIGVEVMKISSKQFTKTGNWKETSDSNYIYWGSYENGKRQGVWLENKIIFFNERSLTYNNVEVIKIDTLNYCLYKKRDLRNDLKSSKFEIKRHSDYFKYSDTAYLTKVSKQGDWGSIEFNFDSLSNLEIKGLSGGYNHSIWVNENTITSSNEKGEKLTIRIIFLSKNTMLIKVINDKN